MRLTGEEPNRPVLDDVEVTAVPSEAYTETHDSTLRGERNVAGRVDHACWLTDHILLILCSFHADAEDRFEAALARDQQILPIQAKYMSYAGSGAEDDPRAGKVIVARFPRSDGQLATLGRLIIQTGSRRVALDPADLAAAVTDLQTLLRSGIAALEADVKSELINFVASVAGTYSEPADSRLSEALSRVRDALRERLPHYSVSPQQPLAFCVEALLGLDDRSFYVKGWIKDDAAKAARLTFVSPEGCRADLLGRLFRYSRRDIPDVPATSGGDHDYGFISYFDVKAPNLLTTGWMVETGAESGAAVEVPAPPVFANPPLVLNTIIGDLIHERPGSDDLTRNHAYPALTRLRERCERLVQVDREDAYGRSCESPVVSVVIPLYQRIDFLEHQLAQFVGDPEIQRTELIYALDSPELADKLRERAVQLFSFYRVPFRVLTLKRNAGYAGVNNIAATFARGRLLLLLNSDVLPDRPGWIEKMAAFYDSTPRIGALGAKLLFEDDSLQHAGMYFNQLAGSPLWENRHYFKGLHRHLSAANVSRPVPAVTAACLMIDRRLYEDAGGLRDIYIRGGYEDSDFCLRLIEKGYENWYLAEAELYHLEGQSFPFQSRKLTTQYNRWLHTHLWRERMEEVMKKIDYTPAAKT